jgi:hypothetical protein
MDGGHIGRADYLKLPQLGGMGDGLHPLICPPSLWQGEGTMIHLSARKKRECGGRSGGEKENMARLASLMKGPAQVQDMDVFIQD